MSKLTRSFKKSCIQWVNVRTNNNQTKHVHRLSSLEVINHLIKQWIFPPFDYMIIYYYFNWNGIDTFFVCLYVGDW